MMTLRELGELVIWLGGIALALGAIGGVLHFAIVRPLRKWIKEQVGAPLKETAASLKTSNGKTAGGFIEDSAKDLRKIQGDLAAVAEELKVTNQLALQAQTLALGAERRMDTHLANYHSAEGVNHDASRTHQD